MQQRNLGPFSVSAIGLGCMNMSMGYGPVADENDSAKLLNAALDQGYSFLDTAAMYGMGHNEELIGKYLCGRRHEYTLASKCGIFRGKDGNTEINGRPEVLQRTCEASLKRLNTEVIDLYYLHRADPSVPLEDSVGQLSRLVEQGKIQAIGLSEVCDDNLRLAHRVHPISALQSEYSLWSRTPERKILASCEELGIAFVPFSPLGRQFLTGKSPGLDEMTGDDLRQGIARPRFEPENLDKNRKLLPALAQIAQSRDCSMAQLALAWLLAQGDNIIPVPGTKHIDYMVENAGAGELQLDDSVVDELNQLINEDTVSGRRYTDALMASTDSEKD